MAISLLHPPPPPPICLKMPPCLVIQMARSSATSIAVALAVTGCSVRAFVVHPPRPTAPGCATSEGRPCNALPQHHKQGGRGSAARPLESSFFSLDGISSFFSGKLSPISVCLVVLTQHSVYGAMWVRPKLSKRSMLNTLYFRLSSLVCGALELRLYRSLYCTLAPFSL